MGVQKETTFFVRNNSSQPVQVQLKGLQHEVRLSHPLEQVVPSEETAGFTIVYQSRAVGEQEAELTYVVNGLAFVIQYEVKSTLMDVSITRDNVKFMIAQAKALLFQEELAIKNASPSACNFKVRQAEHFSISPEEGVVQSKSELKLVLSYRPGAFKTTHQGECKDYKAQ